MSKNNVKLRMSDIRRIEAKNNVFLVELRLTHKNPTQRFNVFNSTSRTEEFIGFVEAQELFFGEDELEKEIRKLFA
ncbi:hypothetical protein GF369_04580 [Candidatus Peregrinibacteria bacterium]|nr:hypothetical protein [Candidatus Peregrinibacteria bacterium]